MKNGVHILQLPFHIKRLLQLRRRQDTWQSLYLVESIAENRFPLAKPSSHVLAPAGRRPRAASRRRQIQQQLSRKN